MVKNIDHMRSFLALLVLVKFYGESIASVYSITLTGVTMNLVVKLRRGSGKDRQGMAPKAKGLKA